MDFYEQFSALFPELANGGVTSIVFGVFQEPARLLFDFDNSCLVADDALRQTLGCYALAHLASVSGYPVVAPATNPSEPAPVGRVSSATEGSVSVSLDMGAVAENAAWWMQTQYGATFWNMTRALRTVHYRPAAPRYFGPAFGFIGRFR